MTFEEIDKMYDVSTRYRGVMEMISFMSKIEDYIKQQKSYELTRADRENTFMTSQALIMVQMKIIKMKHCDF